LHRAALPRQAQTRNFWVSSWGRDPRVGVGPQQGTRPTWGWRDREREVGERTEREG
jgi:hypothetical protein